MSNKEVPMNQGMSIEVQAKADFSLYWAKLIADEQGIKNPEYRWNYAKKLIQLWAAEAEGDKPAIDELWFELDEIVKEDEFEEFQETDWKRGGCL
jgi:hypothetical protein